jgi:UDPglucose 6-dehydrogenase/GDP-mannose 6-dehydrogenase
MVDMKVSVIGTGYVGIVTGACFAEKGHSVICVDVDQAKVDLINNGTAPIHERGLADLLKKHAGDRLRATTDLTSAVHETDLSLIAVGTPFDGKGIDLTFIKNVARELGTALRKKPGYHVVVVKSTVVPGTTDEVVLPILEDASGKKAGVDFGVGMNPELSMISCSQIGSCLAASIRRPSRDRQSCTKGFPESRCFAPITKLQK